MNRKRQRASILTMTAVAAAVWAAQPVLAVDDVSLNVAAGSEFVTPGDTATVTLDATNLSGAINGVQVLIQYDANLMTLIDITSTNLGLVPPAEGWVKVFQEDQAGMVTYAAAVNGGSVLTDGTLATLTFSVIGEGSSVVAFRPDAPPFQTKLTHAADNATILPNVLDSGPIVTESVHISGLETFYAGRFLTCQGGTNNNAACISDVDCPGGLCREQADPSRHVLASGSAAAIDNVTNYVGGITGLRIFFDKIVTFATTPDAAVSLAWTTGAGTSFSPVTDAAAAMTVTPTVEQGRTVLTIVLNDDHVRRRWLEVRIDAAQVFSGGVTLDGELTGNPVSLPSGDGIPGGDAIFYLGNAAGDVNGNRRTALLDVALIRASLNPFLPVPVDHLLDVDKDGRLRLSDAGKARLDVNPFFTLPLITP